MIAIVDKDKMFIILKNGTEIQPWYKPTLEEILANALEDDE